MKSPLQSSPASSARLRGNEGPLRFSAFVPAQAVTQHLSAPESIQHAIRQFRENHIQKVILDCLRGGHFPGEAVLTRARDTLREAGFQVTAGLTPTRGTGKGSTHGRWWLCYTNTTTQNELEDVVRRTVRLFDEIIVDDFLCTHCQCNECRRARGERDWAVYYRDLLTQVAEERIIRPAKQENPDAWLIIKYPQWYDRFHVFGYDVRHHPARFDEVWVGTEIRDPLVEYVQQPQAFVNYRWLASLSGEKIGGAWFDFINCYPAVYVEQAVQSILAGARELVRFHYDPELYSRANPNTAALLEAIPDLEQLVTWLDARQPQGIAFYKPPDSDGADEVYLPDYLGMLGLPLIPQHTFPREAPAACLSIHATSDPEIVPKALEFVERGGLLLLTPGFIQQLRHDPRVFDLTGLDWPAVTDTDLWSFRFSVQGNAVDAEAHVHFGARLHPRRAEVLAWSLHPSGNLPLLTRQRHGTGKTLVLNARTFRYPPGSGRVTTGEPVSLPHLPQPFVDLLRKELLVHFPLEVEVRSRVGVYCHSGILVLTNFNDQPVEVKLRPRAETGIDHLETWGFVRGPAHTPFEGTLPARQFGVCWIHE